MVLAQFSETTTGDGPRTYYAPLTKMHTALLLPCMIVHVNDHPTKPPPPPWGSPPEGDPPGGNPEGEPPGGNPPKGGSPHKHDHDHITCSKQVQGGAP